MNEERPGSVYDKWNIFVVICDTDIPYRLTKSSFPYSVLCFLVVVVLDWTLYCLFFFSQSPISLMYNKIIEQFFNHRTLCLNMAQTSLYFDIHNLQLINCGCPCRRYKDLRTSRLLSPATYRTTNVLLQDMVKLHD